MQNPNIYRRIASVKWQDARFDPGKKSLAYIFHIEQGWTVEGMKDVTSTFKKVFLIEIIGNSPIPMVLPTLSRAESRVLWGSLRYKVKMNQLKASLKFEVDLDIKFLVAPLKYQSFHKKR